MKTAINIKVRGYHIDHFHHVNNARYLEFLEEARWHYCEENDLIEEFHRRGMFHVTVNININYKRSAFVGDILRIETSVENHDRKSLTMKQQIFLGESNELIVEAAVTNVFLDQNTQKIIPVTKELIHFWPGIVNDKKHQPAVR